MDYKLNKGFTLIEILAVLGILVIISALSYVAFINLNKSQVIERNTAVLVSILEEARSLAVSGKEASRYGVYLELAGNKIVLFRGDDFDPEDPNNKETFLHSSVIISEVNLDSGGTEVVFGRLRGETEDHGSIILSLVNEPEMIKTVAIYPTGAVQMIN